MLILPVRPNELQAYKPENIDAFNVYINEHTRQNSVYFLDYSRDNRFETKDYTTLHTLILLEQIDFQQY